MTYLRVIPRDLFNEANLLKCLGRLVLIADDACPGGGFRFVDYDGEPFRIEQDENTGAIECTSLQLLIDGRPVRLTRPLNSREAWPLYVEPANDGEWFDPVAVFEDDGELTAEFAQLVGLEQPGIIGGPVGFDPPEGDEAYPPPCTDPGGHEWPRVEENERCLCVHCGADGDA